MIFTDIILICPECKVEIDELDHGTCGAKQCISRHRTKMGNARRKRKVIEDKRISKIMKLFIGV